MSRIVGKTCRLWFPFQEIGFNQKLNLILEREHPDYNCLQLDSLNELLFSQKLLEAILTCSKTVTHLILECCCLKASSIVKILKLVPKLNELSMKSCSFDGAARQSHILVIPRELKKLQIIDSPGLFIIGNNFLKLTEIEIEIDDRWSKEQVHDLAKFIETQRSSLKSLKIINNDCKNAFKCDAKCQLDSFSMLNQRQNDSLATETTTPQHNYSLFQLFKTQKKLKCVELSIESFDSFYYHSIHNIINQNKFLQELKLKVKSSGTNKDFLDQIVTNSNNNSVTSLSFDEKCPSKLLQQLTKSLPNITNLTLNCNGEFTYDSEKCKWISMLKHLSSLSLANVHYFALQYLKNKALKSVDIDFSSSSVYPVNHVSDYPVYMFFSNNQQLQLLQISFLSEENCLDLIGLLPELKQLKVVEFDKPGACVEILAKSKQLNSLAIPASKLSTIPMSSQKLLQAAGKLLLFFEIDFPY